VLGGWCYRQARWEDDASLTGLALGSRVAAAAAAAADAAHWTDTKPALLHPGMQVGGEGGDTPTAQGVDGIKYHQYMPPNKFHGGYCDAMCYWAIMNMMAMQIRGKRRQDLTYFRP